MELQKTRSPNRNVTRDQKIRLNLIYLSNDTWFVELLSNENNKKKSVTLPRQT